MPFSILASSDLHLGRRSSGIREAGNDISTKTTWDRIVKDAISRKVDLVALAGDIIDRDNRYFEAIGPIQSGFKTLKDNDIQVLIVAGNHDFDVISGILTKGSYENVTLLGANGKWSLHTIKKENHQIQFAGWSFPTLHYKDNPLRKFDQIQEQINTSHPVIAMVHTDVGIEGSPYGQAKLEDMTGKPVQAWILGHIHTPSVLNEHPLVLYPGSPQALSAKENDCHGPVLINVSDTGSISHEFLSLSPVRFESMDIEITPEMETDDIREIISSSVYAESTGLLDQLVDVNHLSWDIRLVGEHSELSRIETMGNAYVNEYSASLDTSTKIQIRKITSDLQPALENLERLAGDASPAGKLAETILAIEGGTSTPFLEKMLEQWKQKAKKVDNSPVYQPVISQSLENIEYSKDRAIQFIKKECRKLLGVLLAQNN